jgi:hypothetical protein
VVLVDFKYLDESIKQRMIAFLEGALFGIDGRKVVLRDDLIALLPEGALAEENIIPSAKIYERKILQR